MNISKERLDKIASWREKYGANANVTIPAAEAEEMARYILGRQKQAPVAWRCVSGTIAEQRLVTLNKPVADHWRDKGHEVIPLYAAPAPQAVSGNAGELPVKIQQMKPERDEFGYWTHPKYLEFCDDREFIPREELDEWAANMGMEWGITHLECDDLSRKNQAVNHSYFEDGNPDVSNWVPTAPDGNGWFIISIHDTEDGPVCCWMRDIEASNG